MGLMGRLRAKEGPLGEYRGTVNVQFTIIIHTAEFYGI